MKKLILILIVTLNSINLNSQTIQALNVSPNGTESVDVNLNVVHFDYIQYQGLMVETIGNVINLKVCYEYAPAPSVSDLNNTFNITINNPVNYILNIEIYRVPLTLTCTYSDLTDSATLNFTTPLSGIIHLGIDDYIQLNNKITIRPNPVVKKLNYSVSDNLNIETIEVYNILGQKFITFNKGFDNIMVDNLNNGVYFVVFNTNKGLFLKKIVIKH